MYLVNEKSNLANCSTDFGPLFRGDAQLYLGILMRGKSLHNLTFAYDIIGIHSLMFYNHIVECQIVGDTKAPLFRSSPFISKLKLFDIKTTGKT